MTSSPGGGSVCDVVISRRSSPIESFQRLRRVAAQVPDQAAVVVVGDLPGPVVELELLEGGQRAVALLLQGEGRATNQTAATANRAPITSAAVSTQASGASRP
jgi:hypothetical protein